MICFVFSICSHLFLWQLTNISIIYIILLYNKNETVFKHEVSVYSAIICRLLLHHVTYNQARLAAGPA